MNAITFIAIIALAASAVYAAEDSQATKKQDKRGVLGLGYGGYNAGHGIHGGLALGGYGYSGLGHGYVAASSLPSYTLDHAIAAPVSISHGVHSIPSAPILSAPLGVGYGHSGLGYSGLSLGHGLSYGHGW